MFDESTLRERSIFRIKITYRIISFLFFLILLEEELKYLASFKRVLVFRSLNRWQSVGDARPVISHSNRGLNALVIGSSYFSMRHRVRE